MTKNNFEPKIGDYYKTTFEHKYEVCDIVYFKKEGIHRGSVIGFRIEGVNKYLTDYLVIDQDCGHITLVDVTNIFSTPQEAFNAEVK